MSRSARCPAVLVTVVVPLEWNKISHGSDFVGGMLNTAAIDNLRATSIYRFPLVLVYGRALVRIVLLDMVRKPKTREYHDATRTLRIITGMGNNSKDGEAVIKVRRVALSYSSTW